MEKNYGMGKLSGMIMSKGNLWRNRLGERVGKRNQKKDIKRKSVYIQNEKVYI